MKNFLELLDTELHLTVTVNGHQQNQALDSCMTFCADDHVVVDGIEILPRYRYLARDNVLSITEPFYRWYHQASGQGWLLTPHDVSTFRSRDAWPPGGDIDL